MAFPSKDIDERCLTVLAETRLIGTARAEISCLEFIEGREIDSGIVRHLMGVFDQENCRRYESRNFIPVLITKSNLKRALRESKLEEAALRSPAHDGSLHLLKTAKDQKLLCLDGRHRVEAAKNIFESEDQWWTIRIFFAKSNDEAQRLAARWRDGYYHQTALSDGEVFRRAWPYVEQGLEEERDLSMVCLSDSKQEALKRLFNHKVYAKRLGALSDLPGQWRGLKLGDVRTLLKIKCVKELEWYLKRIKTEWNRITLNLKHVKQFADIRTVENLQGLAPGVSKIDREFVIGAMENKYLFPGLVDPSLRRRVKEALLKTSCLIPSIKTMFENLKLLAVGATLIKELIVGKDNGGTVHSILKENWKTSQDCFVETSPGDMQVVRNLSVETCWDLTYKQLWIAVLRGFADLGGRTPRKETGGSLYKAKLNPSCQYRLAKFASDLGFDTEKIRDCIANDPRKEELRASVGHICKLQPTALEKIVDDVLRQLPLDEEIETKQTLSRQIFSKTDIGDLKRRWGVPFTRAYERGKVEFYLPQLLTKATKKDDDMPGSLFIQKDFIDAFFGPTQDFRDGLRDFPKETDSGRPTWDDISACTSSSEDEPSSEDGLYSSEENFDMGDFNPPTGAAESSPGATLSEGGGVTAVNVTGTESDELPRPIIHETIPSLLLTVAESPELSPVASISSVFLREGLSTPASVFEAIATFVTPEEQDQPLSERTMHLADDQSGAVESSSLESDMLSLVAVAPRMQADSPSTAQLPQERPRSPIMSFQPTSDLLPYKPTSNVTLTQPTGSTKLSSYVPSSTPLDEDMVISRRDISRDSAYQLPSEPRRSILSWPMAAMLEAPDQSVESYPSALVPYQLPPERESLPLMEPEIGASLTNNQQLILLEDIGRSTPSNSLSTMEIVQDSDDFGDLQDGTGFFGAGQLLVEPAPPSVLDQSKQIDLPPEPRRSVDSLPLSYMADDPPISVGQLMPASGSQSQVEQAWISNEAGNSSPSTAAQISLPPEARRSIISLPSLHPTGELPLNPAVVSPSPQPGYTKLPTQQVATNWFSEATSQSAQPPIWTAPPDIDESRERQRANTPTREPDEVELLDNPPATIFRFFEYNGMFLKPISLVSRVNMEIYLKSRRNWTWFKRDGYRFRTIRADKIIDSMVRSHDIEYYLMPKEKANWWIKNGANVWDDHLRKRERHTTSRVDTGHQRRHSEREAAEAAANNLRKRYLQKRKRLEVIRGHPEENAKQIRTALPGDMTMSTIVMDPNPRANDMIALPEELPEELPENVAWISSRLWITKVKVFDGRYNLEDCEKEQHRPNWALPSSELCFLIYGAASRSLVVFNALQPLQEEDKRLVGDKFLFIIATPKFDEVDLQMAIKVAPDFAIWLVPRNELNVFKDHWSGDHKSGWRRTIQVPTEIQSAPPDAGESLTDDSLFDDDSSNDGYETPVSIKSHAVATGGSSSQQADASNSELVVYQKAEAQDSWSASNLVPGAHIIVGPPETDALGPARSFIEDGPGEKISSPSAVASGVSDKTIDSVAEIEELGATTLPPEGSNSARIGDSSSGPSTHNAKNTLNVVSNMQKHLEFDSSGLEGLASLQERKRPYINEDIFNIRINKDKEPEAKKPRMEMDEGQEELEPKRPQRKMDGHQEGRRRRMHKIFEKHRPNAGTLDIQSQIDNEPKEPEQKQLRGEEDGGERAQEGTKVKFVGLQVKAGEEKQGENTQKHLEFDSSGLEGLASLQERKRPYIQEDTVDIRRNTDKEPEAKRLDMRPERDKIFEKPLPSAGIVDIQFQTEKEPEQKQRRGEEEGGEKAQEVKFVGSKAGEEKRGKIGKRRGRRAGILEKWKQRKTGHLAPEEFTPGRGSNWIL